MPKFTQSELKLIIASDKRDIEQAKRVIYLNNNLKDSNRYSIKRFIKEKELNILLCEKELINLKIDKIRKELKIKKLR